MPPRGYWQTVRSCASRPRAQTGGSIFSPRSPSQDVRQRRPEGDRRVRRGRVERVGQRRAQADPARAFRLERRQQRVDGVGVRSAGVEQQHLRHFPPASACA